MNGNQKNFTTEICGQILNQPKYGNCGLTQQCKTKTIAEQVYDCTKKVNQGDEMLVPASKSVRSQV